MQGVERRPPALARPHALHRGLVAGAPGERELVARHAELERVDLARDRAVPVDDRAEDVEDEELDAVHFSRNAALSCVPSSGFSKKGSVGLRASMTSSSRVCTPFSACGWL